MYVRVKSEKVRQDVNTTHPTYMNRVVCPYCGMMIFVPFIPSEKKGKVDFCFKCVYCDKKVKILIVQN